MIPLVRPVLPSRAEIWRYFEPALKSGQISNFGPCYQLLVERVGKLTGRHALPVANGTVAIQLAIQTQFWRGANILVPDYTHIGTLQAVVAAGCNPILIPVRGNTWTVDPLFLETGLRTYDGAVVVSPFGYPVDFAMYDRIAKATGKKIIYDLAGAWGMELKTRATVCMSLHATKNFSCGEGGLVLFSNRTVRDLTRRLSNFDTLLDRSIASPYGGNHKPDELKCAIALAHLDRNLDMLRKSNRKWLMAKFYATALGCQLPDLTSAAPSLCVVKGLPAKFIEANAAAHGFVAKQYYPLLSRMPGLKGIACLMRSPDEMERCLALPSDVTLAEAKKVVAGIKRILASY